MVMSQLDLSELYAYCTLYGEKFPLLAAHLACKVLQQSLQQQSNVSSSTSKLTTHSHSSSQGSHSHASRKASSELDLLSSLSFLCHANIPPPPPEPWQESFFLLQKALKQFLQHQAPSDLAQQLQPMVSQLDLNW